MIEVNFLDVLSRKAVRLRGRAKRFSKGAPEFGPLFAALSVWKGYTELMKAVVRVDIEKATLILSPAYDIGHTEAQLRARTKRNSLHFEGLGQFLPLASSSLTPHVGYWQEAVKPGGASSGSATHPMYGPAVISKFSENRSRGHRCKCLLLALGGKR
jgi:hypothetical protein